MTTHNYAMRYFGHDYVFEPIDGGQKGRIMGWGEGISKDDFIILVGVNPSETTRYQFTRIRYYSDPPDMWEGDVVFAPRPLTEKVEQSTKLAESKTAFFCKTCNSQPVELRRWDDPQGPHLQVICKTHTTDLTIDTQQLFKDSYDVTDYVLTSLSKAGIVKIKFGEEHEKDR